MQFPDQEKEAETERKKQAEEKERAKRLLELPTEHCFDREADAYLQSVFAWKYPYETDWEIPGKLSVSELKKMSAAPEESDCAFLYQAEPVVPLIPRFRQEEEPIVGAQRGTIFHKFMEFYDFSRPDELELQLEEQITCGKMSREEGESIRLLEIRRFLRTRTGAKMAAAAQRGELFREKPFVLGVSADTIHSSWSAEETVLIQGIIDAYYLDEDGQIVIVDYKTDRVTAAEELVVKYRTQLEYYAAALKRLTGRTIRSLVIYSFCLGKEIFI